jgi:aminopeptidase N
METIALLALALLFSGSMKNEEVEVVYADETVVEQKVYHAAETQLNDIIHTDLAVRFDWANRHLIGEADLIISPYFYATNELVLDAKGFDIHQVDMDGNPLRYDYDGRELHITLDREYTRHEQYNIHIAYTAKPDELNEKGSSAISQAKGLYFINPDGRPGKPQQIWTQGETEASSCWFPTIDTPNERMTQNIAITVQDRFTTLSNGILVKSEERENGMRTDYWEQKFGHVPYLAMMAIGEFNITTDKWRDLAVDYYLEDEFHPNAKKIFGRTPKMMGHFSKVLGVDYPWEKYAQVVVRDFVSGAMENTTGVIHGEFVQMDNRELLDRHEEDIIAHELFHHWFGNLVTCESWANLPLNESFATYGEYIWREEGFGRMAADKHLDADLRNYLNESKRKQVDMIRFDYEDKEDMFDSHSYAKGGRILHMLRNYLGDEAFYLGLQKYLEDNAFTAVEMHELRLAMEDVCGEDLNWFFNQWFFASGHPILVIEYNYIDSSQTQEITIEQIQDLSTTPLYRLPMSVDLYVRGKVERHEIDMTEKKQVFSLPCSHQPTNVVVDAEHMLLAEIYDEKPSKWWVEQQLAPLYIDQKLCLQNVDSTDLLTVLNRTLNHDYWGVRELAIKEALRLPNPLMIEETIFGLAESDENTSVRAAAIEFLSESVDAAHHFGLFETAAHHPSYTIAGAALTAMAKVNEESALNLAPMFEASAKNDQEEAILKLYAKHGGPDKAGFFTKKIEGASNYGLYRLSILFTHYLNKQDLETVLAHVGVMETMADEATSWMVYVSEANLKKIKERIVVLMAEEDNEVLLERAERAVLRISDRK